jgi:hypothetical protein
MKTGIRGYPDAGPADECAYSSPKNLMKRHIHPLRKMIMTRRPEAGVINWHLRD